VINKLQDVFNAVGGEKIDLPQITVVGSQSSGKSSVLEHVVGRDFLPRGSGIVTRRPLILQLINIPQVQDPQGTEWGEFLHKPNTRFYDFDKIRQEIEVDTDRIAGHRGISPEPIRLRIYSPNVLNLTLVDLPGVTKIAVDKQDVNLPKKIEELILSYISNPNAIILAVTAANTDMANSDGILLAKRVDPEGYRTIGVLTKIDIMDRGTDAVDMLMGKVIPLRLGFVGVVNRSQADINAGKPIREALKSEKTYFLNHPLYRGIASRLGTEYLSKLLNRLLMSHIKDSLPELKAKITSMMNTAQSEMESYGDPMYEGKGSMGAALLNVIHKFSEDYCNAIDGRLSELATNELYGGARINFIFTEIYTKCINGISLNDAVSLNDILTAIKNTTGPRAALFVPEESFETLVKSQIKRLEEPSLQCVELVYDELKRIVGQLELKELQRFATLRRRLVEVVHNLLNNCRDPTRKMINNLISIERSYINTSHKDFIGGSGAMSKMFENMSRNPQQLQPNMARPNPVVSSPNLPPNAMNPALQRGGPAGFGGGPAGFGGGPAGFGAPPSGFGGHSVPRLGQMPQSIHTIGQQTEKERFETELIQNLISSYFDIVRKNISDCVPKSIMHFLVNTSKVNIRNELVKSLYKEELFEELLEENPEMANRRKACKEMLDALTKANEVLLEVRDFNLSLSLP